MFCMWRNVDLIAEPAVTNNKNGIHVPMRRFLAVLRCNINENTEKPQDFPKRFFDRGAGENVASVRNFRLDLLHVIRR